jgi:hypothetical protein
MAKLSPLLPRSARPCCHYDRANIFSVLFASCSQWFRPCNLTRHDSLLYQHSLFSFSPLIFWKIITTFPEHI